MNNQGDVSSRRGGFKRLGIVALSGLVIAGLTPAVVNVAFADATAGEKKIIDVELTNIDRESARIPDEVMNQTDATVLVTPKEGQDSCPTISVEGAGGKFGTGTGGKLTDKLGFTADEDSNPTEDKVCTYTVKLKTPTSASASVQYDRSAYKLEWHFTAGLGASDEEKKRGTWDYRLKKFDDGIVTEDALASSDKESKITFQNVLKYWSVSFTNNDNSLIQSKPVPNEGKITEVPTNGQCTNPKAIFEGWLKNGSGSTLSVDTVKSAAHRATASVTYKAKCVAPHTVKFYKEGTADTTAGTTLPVASVKHNTPLLETDFPKHANTACTDNADGNNKRIAGWKLLGADDSTAKTKTDLMKPEAKVTADINYVAVCQPIVKVKVTLDANGGTLGANSQADNTIEAGKAFAMPTNNPTPPAAMNGAKFLFWTADGATGSAKYDFGSEVTSNITLTAIYGYSVTYNKAADHLDADKVIGVEEVPAGRNATGGAAKGAATVRVGDNLDSFCKATDAFKEWTVAGTATPVAKGAFPANVTQNLNLTAKCESKPVAPPAPPAPPAPQPSPSSPSTPSTPSGSGTGGGYSGGYYTPSVSPSPSTPAKKTKDENKPQPKKPQAQKPGVKQPVESRFDQQFKTPVKLAKEAVTRAAGANRVDTSLQALSQVKNHDTVVLATGSSFPDALVGGALAGAMKAGVVLTTNDTLEPAILKQLQASGTKNVQIVGGYGAVSAAKEAALKAAGFQVVRLAGGDRYETAKLVKEATRNALGLKGNAKAKLSCNATGSNFPDALACASAAAMTGGVVDLVKPGTTVAADAMAEKTICAGGAACVAAGSGVNKVVGSDRYETAYKIAELAPATGKVVVSNASSVAADALVAGALSASTKARLILSDGKRVNLPADTKNAQLIGGKAALPDNIPMFTR